MELEDIGPGQRLSGVVPGEAVEVVQVREHGADAVTLFFERADGEMGRSVLYRADASALSLARESGRPFDADARDFRLAAEAQRIRLAGLHDPMLAVATSDVQPLPHQIRAVYGEMLHRSPLRFLLADDPGAGKTIMAGLLVKELMLREDVRRCLIVAPGGLVEQWQDELWFKFGLEFDVLTAAAAESVVARPVFETSPLLIARMDQLTRNADLLAQLEQTEWDLVVVDEAHRMAARYFGGELKKTRRFELGELLGGLTRHLLLMTATPHAGKDEDFQLFLTLLDQERFAGRFRRGVSADDTADVMRRMVKEDLLTFEGKALFPERVAQTVPYDLTDAELDLYEQVTAYVREEMNRAAALDGRRRNTVGFALTVLQRRLASSPEAIYQSLVRRASRLEKRKTDLVNGVNVVDRLPGLAADDDLDDDDFGADEVEDVEDELVDAATAARTVVELEAELVSLRALVEVAREVRALDTDRKWVELRGILEGESVDKIIVFTEHRDTLDYLQRKISGLLGDADAVLAIHGGVARRRRREITEEFTHNARCRVLLATDAAGEGLNLQVAHLMVNYDLPWNPNRIEQRFGRVHRIGQREVCRLWNLVARNTREGAVFDRLLEKVEEQRKAYGGRVFDVLGKAFDAEPLRDLLVEAIRYGERPEVRARMEQVIDERISDGLHDLLQDQALARESMADADVAELRRQMEEARARRLQPHFIQAAFTEAFRRAGGRLIAREKGRFEITHVPPLVRERAEGPVATRYERVAFELDQVERDGSRAQLVAPGHPLHDAVLDVAVERFGSSLEAGALLVSPHVSAPSLLVGLVEEVVDAAGSTVSRRFGYAYVSESGAVADAGPAPYLDCVAAPSGVDVEQHRAWAPQAECAATDWIVAHRLPAFLDEIRLRRGPALERTRRQVQSRMSQEINRLAAEAMTAADKERQGRTVREGEESLVRKSRELEARLERRLVQLDREARLSTVPPRIVAAALVLPVPVESGETTVSDHTIDTTVVERRAVDAVLAAERALGRTPEEMPHNNPGYDIRSTRGLDPVVFVEVKGRIAGAEDFIVTHTEVRHGQNAVPHYRLALASVDPRGPEHDAVRYLDDPFRDLRLGLDTEKVVQSWAKSWTQGRSPH